MPRLYLSGHGESEGLNSQCCEDCLRHIWTAHIVAVTKTLVLTAQEAHEESGPKFAMQGHAEQWHPSTLPMRASGGHAGPEKGVRQGQRRGARKQSRKGRVGLSRTLPEAAQRGVAVRINVAVAGEVAPISAETFALAISLFSRFPCTSQAARLLARARRFRGEAMLGNGICSSHVCLLGLDLVTASSRASCRPGARLSFDRHDKVTWTTCKVCDTA